MSSQAEKARALEGASLYVRQKITHMNRHAVPASVNPETGAARPEWKAEADKATEKKRHRWRFVFPGPDIEFATRVTNRRPRRPLSDVDHARRAAALAAFRGEPQPQVA